MEHPGEVNTEVSREAILSEALELIEREALYAHRVNWPEVRSACWRLLVEHGDVSGLHSALRHALEALGDAHSFLRLPDADSVHRGLLGLYYVAGTVAVVFPESPAELAGLRPGDRILKVQGQPVGDGVNAGLSPEPYVHLEISQAGVVREVNLVRADVPVHHATPVGWRLRDDIGLVCLPECHLSGVFEDGETYQQKVRDVLHALSRAGVRRWVVDLRLNLGGNMWPMLSGIGPLAGEGDLGAFVREQERWPWRYERGQASIGGDVLAQTAGDVLPSLSETVPVAVLTSALTASSGEIIALSFLGRPGTRVFGEATRGLTTSNSLYELADGSALLLTTAMDADRTGKIYDHGVQPDVVVVNDWHDFRTDRDPVVRAAIDWLELRSSSR